MSSQSVFSELRQLGAVLDKKLPKLQEQVQNWFESHSEKHNSMLALKNLEDDVKEMKNKVNSLTIDCKSLSPFGEFVDSCASITRLLQGELEQKETYLKQYGFQPLQIADTFVDNIDLNIIKEEEPRLSSTLLSEDDDEKENNPRVHPSELLVKPNVIERTPQPSDFGISRETLALLKQFSLNKKKEMIISDKLVQQHLVTPPLIETRNVPAQRSSTPILKGPNNVIPLDASYDLVVTPGLLSGQTFPLETPIQYMQNSGAGYGNLQTYDTPSPPIFKTPGIKQLKKGVKTSPNVTPEEPQLSGVYRLNFHDMSTKTPQSSDQMIELSTQIPDLLLNNQSEHICASVSEETFNQKSSSVVISSNKLTFSTPMCAPSSACDQFRLPFLSEEEYDKEGIFIKKLFSLKQINLLITRINQLFQEHLENGKPLQIYESELDEKLNIGPETNAILLLLVREQRLCRQLAMNGSREKMYIPADRRNLIN